MDQGNEYELSELSSNRIGEQDSKMLAQQYLLSQADYCRRKARQVVDPFVAAELIRLAALFERSALAALDRADVTACDPAEYRGATHAA